MSRRFDQDDDSEAIRPRRFARLCARCGQPIVIARDEPFLITVWCDACLDLGMETQQRLHADETRRRSA